MVRAVTVGTPSTVAVVGAGGSGIAAATALKRAGLRFDVLEARNGLGGTWRYDPDGYGSACYRSLVANTSKLRTQMGFRRIDGRPWQYASHTEMLGYLESIAEAEGLRPHLHFGWRAASAEHRDGQWVLRSETGEERTYRALVCALGVNGCPRWSPVGGEFSGEQIHSASYRTPEPFAGRDVIVIGLGTSGREVAGDLAGHARNIVVSARTPMWGYTRRWARIPLDWIDVPPLARVLPWSLRRSTAASIARLTTGRLRRYGVPRATRRFGDDIVAVSDSFPRAVRRGLIDFRVDIAGAEGDQVAFGDGSSARADAIIHATGFDLPTSFLPADARPDGESLYHGIVHTRARALYFVGLVEAHRALLPIAEAQALWTADVLAGRIDVPAPEQQLATAREEARMRIRNFGTRREFLVDGNRYIARLRRERRVGRALGKAA
jgi:hypothetical protein